MKNEASCDTTIMAAESGLSFRGLLHRLRSSQLISRSYRDHNGGDDNATEKREHDQQLLEDSIHWRAPALMVVFLISALLCAVVHNQVYAAYDGKPVSTSVRENQYQIWNQDREQYESAPWWMLLSQQSVFRIGTALAFLVKMFLSLSLGVVYIQQLWKALCARGVALEKVDTLFGVMGNVLLLKDVSLWKSYPALATSAVLLW